MLDIYIYLYIYISKKSKISKISDIFDNITIFSNHGVRIMKLTDLTSYATLAVTAAVVSPKSLVVPRLGTINDGAGGATSPAEAKIVIGGPLHVVSGEATWAVFTLMHVLTPVCPPAAVSSRPVLGRVITSADTGGHTQQPLITVGDVTIVEHFK